MTTRRQLLGVLAAPLFVPLIAGCRDVFAPSEPSFLSGPDADGAFRLLVTSDPHNRPPASGNRCIDVGNLIRQYPEVDTYILGDNAHDGGTALQYQYTHKTWGDLYPRIYPSLGNHDVKADPTGKPYYDYYNGVGNRFGKAGERGKGFYTRDYGNWHVVVLNSERRTIEQQNWLIADLAANSRKHIIAMWHKPMYASPGSMIIPLPNQIRPFWRELQNVKAEIVFSGHIHRYERFAPLRADGVRDNAVGIRQFLIGLGGAGSLMPADLGLHPHSQAQVWDTWGLVHITLRPNSYEWKMVDIRGNVRDQGSQQCRKVLASA